MIYDFDNDWVYEVYTQPLRVSDLYLEAGEKVVEMPFISDSERWQLGAGVSYGEGGEVQHIYIKPNVTGIEASLIINTDRRVYHVILKSYSTVHMPIVRWKYLSGFPTNFVTPIERGKAAGEDGADYTKIDPRHLNFGYRMTYGRKPAWLPSLIYDDGKKTYITFENYIFTGEMPGVFEDRKNITNYRVIDNVLVIDKLIKKITLKLGKQELVVEKKK
jgi:type IV secretion system protein VirB9